MKTVFKVKILQNGIGIRDSERMVGEGEGGAAKYDSERLSKKE